MSVAELYMIVHRYMMTAFISARVHVLNYFKIKIEIPKRIMIVTCPTLLSNLMFCRMRLSLVLKHPKLTNT